MNYIKPITNYADLAKLTPSYRILPQEYPTYGSMEKDQLEILNDSLISIPENLETTLCFKVKLTVN